MAKAQHTLSHTGSEKPDSSLKRGFIVLSKGSKRVIVKRPRTYTDAVAAASRHFPMLSKAEIVFKTDALEICNGSLTEISSDVWEELVPLVTELTIGVDASKELVAPSTISLPSAQNITPNPKVQFYLVHDGKKLEVKALPSTKFRAIRQAATVQFGICADDVRLYHSREDIRVSDEDTLASIEIQTGDIIDIFMPQRGGKPVIYLSSPQRVKAYVKLSLASEWDFSAVYPPSIIKSTSCQGLGEEVEWIVETRSDGTLHELKSALDVAYLFWEAHTKPVLVDSPTPSPICNGNVLTERFIPNRATVSDETSVLLTIDAVPQYLEGSLSALSLHTEARTSFITYWLPSFLKHKHIALRFVPQDVYERAAPLEVTPKPDVVTRIFMLFKGVEEDELQMWQDARLRAAESVDRWATVVGIARGPANDSALFRVLEWGGMEVFTE